MFEVVCCVVVGWCVVVSSAVGSRVIGGGVGSVKMVAMRWSAKRRETFSSMSEDGPGDVVCAAELAEYMELWPLLYEESLSCPSVIRAERDEERKGDVGGVYGLLLEDAGSKRSLLLSFWWTAM